MFFDSLLFGRKQWGLAVTWLLRLQARDTGRNPTRLVWCCLCCFAHVPHKLFPLPEIFPAIVCFLLVMGSLLRHLRLRRSRSQVLFSVHIVPHPLRRPTHCIICFAHQVTISWKARTMSHSSFHAQCLAQKPGYNWNSICSCRINRILNETPILSPATWPHIAKLKYLCLHSLGA